MSDVSFLTILQDTAESYSMQNAMQSAQVSPEIHIHQEVITDTDQKTRDLEEYVVFSGDKN